MEQAIRFASAGGPDVMRLEQFVAPEPGPGQLRVRHLAIPVNYLDIQQRSGHYPLALPSGLGVEAAGIVEAVGEGVSDIPVGRPVVYLSRNPGTYATSRLCAAQQAVPIPAGVPPEQMAAVFLRAILAWHLTHQVYALKAGETMLVHAAAGVTGGLIAQFGRMAGCRVIGVVGNPDKALAAIRSGSEEIVAANDPDLGARVRSLTGGAGVDVVYDSVGADSFVSSLESLRPHGMLVAFGNASAPIPPFEPWRELGHRGSLKMAWPMLRDFMAPPHMQLAIPAILTALQSGHLAVEIGHRFALSHAAQAHELIETRQARGATILIP